MKSWIICLFILSGSLSLYSQPFSLIIEEGYESLGLDIIQDGSDFIASVGHLQCIVEPWARSYSIYRISEEGDNLFRRNFDTCPGSQDLNFSGGMQIIENEFVVTVSVWDDSLQNYCLYLDFLNDSFEINRRILISCTDLHDLARCVTRSGDHLFIVYGRGAPTRGDTAMLVTTDLKGRILNRVILDYEHGNSPAISIFSTDDGGALINTWFHDLNTFIRLPVVIRVDSNGNVMWKKNPEDLIKSGRLDDTNCGIAKLAGFNDGSFALSWCKDTSLRPFSRSDNFKEVNFYDSNGEWTDSQLIPTIYESDIRRLKPDDKGNVYGVGYGRHHKRINGAWIFKANQKDGLLWKRFYSPEADSVSSFFFNLNILDDYSIGIIGISTEDTGYGNTWVIKLDSNGCLGANCGIVNVITSDFDIIPLELDFNLYPNPTYDEVALLLNQPAQDDISVMVYSISGLLILTDVILENNNELSLDLSSLKRGTYIVRLINEKGSYGVRRIVRI